MFLGILILIISIFFLNRLRHKYTRLFWGMLAFLIIFTAFLIKNLGISQTIVYLGIIFIAVFVSVTVIMDNLNN